jgi:hypothetical protein
MGELVRLKRKRGDAVREAAQLLLDLPIGLPDAARDALADVVHRRQQPEPWPFVMIAPEAVRAVMRAIEGTARPALTLKVFVMALTYVREGGEVMAGARRIADDTAVPPAEVYRAMGELVKIGALMKLKPGRYAVAAAVAWNGSLVEREHVVRQQPQLALVPAPDTP